MSNVSLETLEKYASERPTPFLKWAGGKSQLVHTFEKFYPGSFGTYFEPFLGGGAVFFDLVSRRQMPNAVISDLNKDLINCYVAVRDQLKPLLTRLHELQNRARDKSFYYLVARRRFNEIRLETGVEGDIEKASLLFYLNKTCYNGLYRVNKSGSFNVPWGRYKNPSIFDEKNIRAVHGVLSRPGVDILCDNYRGATKNVQAKDFVYFDPPYQPVSSTANFTGYTAQSFGWKDQERLAETFRELDERGSGADSDRAAEDAEDDAVRIPTNSRGS